MKRREVIGTTVVRGKHRSTAATYLSRDGLLDDASVNIGEALSRLAGAAAIRKGPSSPDLVLRGLSGERIRTQVEGVRIHGACPSRMDPPVTYLGADVVQGVSLERLPSVTLGPAGLGGTVNVSMDYARLPNAPSEAHADLQGTLDSARQGGLLRGSVYGGTRWLDLRASGSIAELSDYTAGNGTTVPASFEQSGGALSLGLRPRDGHRLWQGFIYRHEANIAFPALPMDNIETSFWLYSARYRIKRRGLVRRIELRVGLSHVDHLMDNRHKANRKQLQAETPAATTTHAAGGRVDLVASRKLQITAGADLNRVGSDAVRSRTLTSGRVFEDHVWPDAAQLDVGGFTEVRWNLMRRMWLRVGGRIDVVHSAAHAKDDRSLGKKTVAQQYVAYYGDEASETDRSELLGAAQAVLRYQLTKALTAHAGTGISTRAAGITERYFAFGPAPGGFMVGNPTLAAENRTLIDVGLRWRSSVLQLEGGAFYSWNANHILPTIIDRRDVNGDGVADRIKGYRNINAQLVGFELAAEIKPLRYLSFPVALSFVVGRNASDDRYLPEIPPLTGSAAVRLIADNTLLRTNKVRGWLEASVRFSADQTLVDEQFGEDETPAFAIVRLTAALQLWQDLQVRLVLDNLFDAHYHEHLSREALLPTGDLKPGDEVPSPGRRLLLSLRARL